jgi:EmrB/QacA subfamily drug resistance transporter
MTQPQSPPSRGGAAAETVRFGTASGRWVLLATVLGSGLAFIDATVVNVALPAIGTDLDAGLAGLQWTINGYTLTLAALILLGGSLGDRYGRRAVFVVGVVWFAAASLLCGLAPNVEILIAARALQGVGGALLTPGSLAILQSSFPAHERARAIGAWSGLGGIAGAAGPFLGGWLVQVASWRWVFLVNLPLAALVVVVTRRHVPESRDPQAARQLDVAGAVTGVVGLGGVTYGLIAWSERGLGSPAVLASLAVGILGMAAFLRVQQRSSHPMVPLAIFRSRQFSATNVVTFAVYGALGGIFFLLVLTLQVVSGFPPIAAGVALLPVTVVMLLLSARAGALGQRIGPRIPMTVGPLIAAIAVVWMSRIGAGASYVRDVLPPVTLFGLGLALTVAPLTATVLAAVADRHAGIASGVNNAVARAAGLLAVAALPLLVGLDGESYADPGQLAPAYRSAMLVCAGLLAAGGLLAAATIRAEAAVEEPVPVDGAAPVEEAERPATEPEPAAARTGESPCRVYCAVAGPPLQPERDAVTGRAAES